MSFWARLKMIKIFVHLLLNPTRTDLIFDAVHLLTNAKDQTRIKHMEDQLLAHSDFKVLYDKAYMPVAPSLAQLALRKEGTFGYAVYQHMSSNGLDFTIWPDVGTRRPLDYMSSRAYLDHDLWHALLGYGIEVSDELAIQAFNVAQLQSPLGIMLIAGGLLRTLVKDPAKALETFQKVVDGYNTGRAARFLLGVKLHDYFDRPLVEVRSVLGVGPRFVEPAGISVLAV